MITFILFWWMYLAMAIIIGQKQYKITLRSEPAENARVTAVMLGISWPITLTYYIIRAVFFEDWI